MPSTNGYRATAWGMRKSWWRGSTTTTQINPIQDKNPSGGKEVERRDLRWIRASDPNGDPTQLYWCMDGSHGLYNALQGGMLCTIYMVISTPYRSLRCLYTVPTRHGRNLSDIMIFYYIQ